MKQKGDAWPRISRSAVEPAARGLCIAWVIGVGIYLVIASPGSDAHAYWAADLADPYRFSSARTDNAYLYSPAFLQVLAPLKLLSFPAFWTLWVAGMLTGVLWLARPYVAALAVLPIEQNPIFTELWYGNIAVLLALMVALAIRYPPVWAFGILTKVTPGIGLLYYVGRGEWRRAGLALGVTASIVAVSFLLAPDAWWTWLEVLHHNATAPAVDGGVRLPALPYRLVLAAVLALLAARWPLLLPISIVLAMPVFWFASLTLLLAWFRLSSQVAVSTDLAASSGEESSAKTRRGTGAPA